MLVLEEGGGEKMVDLLSGVGQFGQFFIYSTKCMPGPEDLERSTEPDWRDKTFVIGALREGPRKYSGEGGGFRGG